MSAYTGLPASAWLDEDGVHVWSQHTCTTGEVTTMLPHPTWHVVEYVVGRRVVEPSIECGGCGYHGVAVTLNGACTECGGTGSWDDTYSPCPTCLGSGSAGMW